MENRQTVEVVDKFNYLEVFKKKKHGGEQITDIIYFKRIPGIGSYELWMSVTPNTRAHMLKVFMKWCVNLLFSIKKKYGS